MAVFWTIICVVTISWLMRSKHNYRKIDDDKNLFNTHSRVLFGFRVLAVELQKNILVPISFYQFYLHFRKYVLSIKNNL